MGHAGPAVATRTLTGPTLVKATIAIPTYNGIEWIADVLDACLQQAIDFEFEVLVIDSGSTDGTVDAVRKRVAVRLHEIPSSSFGHGRTRNLAVELAQGEFVAFITQDAVPANRFWLAELLRPFEIADKIACVYGKQAPRPDCCPTVKRDVINHFRSFGPDHFVILQVDNPHLTSQAERDALTYFSNVNSAVRRAAMKTVPFRDVAYSEDLALGRDVIEAGLIKAYAPLAVVTHSHSYPLRAYFNRMYEEMRGLWLTTGRSIDTSLPRNVAIVVRGTVQDWRFILRDRAYSWPAKLKWLVQAPAYNVARRVAVRLARRPGLPAWAGRAMGRTAVPAPAPDASPATRA
ncbi:MAG: glycosyltransferase family 2 protein [Chloroflexi bacterium]|nr:MAG: glycosyltransferase family 2 protein [Chloroflexota bacterium]